MKKANVVRLSVNNIKVQVEPTYKYLAFMLDSTLSFNHHVKMVANIVTYKSVLLSKVRKYLTEEVPLKIYKSMILPYFDYGDVIYGTASQEGLEKLQRLQSKCLKICKGYNVRFDTDELHTQTKTPLLGLRRETHLNNFMYGMLSNDDFINRRDIRTRTHPARLFKVKTPNLTAYKRSVEYAGYVQWNN